MKTANTPVRPSADLDATDEFPVLDTAAYEAEVLSRDPAARSGLDAGDTESGPAAAESPAPDPHALDATPPAVDSDVMSAVEQWIVQKTEELRAQHEALSLTQRERASAVARAEALSRELAETRANLDALSNRERALADKLGSEQATAQHQTAELDASRAEAARLVQELADARQHQARELAELETRVRDSETRESSAQQTLEARNRTHAELTQRLQQETSARERLAAEVKPLQAQLADCVESLHNRESYRAIYESTLQELDIALAAAGARTAEQEARASQLGAELQAREQQLQGVVRERDQARHLHDTETTHHVAERGEGERKLEALQARLAELTAQHAGTCAQLVAMEAILTVARQRAEAEALASGAAAQRLRSLESEIASSQTDLSGARLETERNRALLADLTAALLKSQTMFSDQSRLLEERDTAAGAMTVSLAEQSALVAKLRGEVAGLTARLAAPEAERRAFEERVGALRKELADSDSRLNRLESLNSELRATVGQLDTLLAERDAELQRATQVASMNAYALGRVQTSIDDLGRTLTASGGASSQAQVSILTRIDGGQNHSVVLRGRTTIGRDRDNDLPLAMRSVSRHHAVLIPAFRTAFVQDLSSTNGVLVNQRRVRCARLEHCDVITCGEATFRYTVAPAPSLKHAS
ncbi:MAG: FHA domain-containing protein [Steroidobacteraceae bacterium]